MITGAHDGAGLLAFLPALLRLALISAHDGEARLGLILIRLQHTQPKNIQTGPPAAPLLLGYSLPTVPLCLRALCVVCVAHLLLVVLLGWHLPTHPRVRPWASSATGGEGVRAPVQCTQRRRASERRLLLMVEVDGAAIRRAMRGCGDQNQESDHLIIWKPRVRAALCRAVPF